MGRRCIQVLIGGLIKTCLESSTRRLDGGCRFIEQESGTMDADLYEQLNTTITTHPRRSEGQGDAITNDQAHPKGTDPVGLKSLDDDGHEQGPRTTSSNLPQEIDQVVQAISSSPWAARFGTFMESVKKQVNFPF